jgi:hypothetical protein
MRNARRNRLLLAIRAAGPSGYHVHWGDSRLSNLYAQRRAGRISVHNGHWFLTPAGAKYIREGEAIAERRRPVDMEFRAASWKDPWLAGYENPNEPNPFRDIPAEQDRRWTFDCGQADRKRDDSHAPIGAAGRLVDRMAAEVAENPVRKCGCGTLATRVYAKRRNPWL